MSVKTITIPIQMFSNCKVAALFFDDHKAFSEYGDGSGGALTRSKQHPDHYRVEMAFSMDQPTIGKGRLLAFLVHEVVHAVQFLAQHYGIKDDEFDAYMADMLVNEILKRDPSLRTR